jgi:transposase
VRQIPPAYAKPFRQGHKNDFRDAYAIAEAVLRPSTRCPMIRGAAAMQQVADWLERRNWAGYDCMVPQEIF